MRLGSKLLKDNKFFSEVDLKKNKNINFNKLAYRSGIKIWWLCLKGHSYLATPHHKTRGRKCPYCTIGTKTVSIEKSILKIKPELAKLWHPTKNGNLKPSEVNAGSRRLCWLLCKNGHEFKTSPKARGHRFTCPYCSGKRITWDNNLEYLYPSIAKQWHPTKNKYKPNEVSPGSHDKAWWICKKKHIFKQEIRYKIKNVNSCTKCHSQISKVQLKIYCELKYVFNDTKLKEIFNKLEIDIYVPSLKLGLEYDGNYYHKDKYLKDRNKNKKLKALSIDLIRFRELPLKKISINDIFVSTNDLKKNDINKLLIKILKLRKNIDNKLRKKIEIYISSENFLRETEYKKLLDDYPYPPIDRSLPYRFPDLIEEWDYEKNNNLNPKLFSYGSNEKVWWICKDFKHSWKATISDRTIKNAGCRICNDIKNRERILQINKSRIGKKRAW